MTPVVLALQRHRDRIDTDVVVTAQHRELVDQVLETFGIAPSTDLNLMVEGQGLPDLSSRLLTSLDALWRRTSPDLVLVQGDTTSSFVASLAAYYLKIPIGHIEAGLRSRDKYSPFPEEMNRRLVDALADYHFAPTQQSKSNLLKEGIPEERITVTGNTGIDALLLMLEQIKATCFVPRQVNPAVFEGEQLILVTAHRRESFGQGLQNICDALRMISRSRPNAAIVYPVHPNPNVRGPVREQLGGVGNIHLTEPLDYPSFIYTMARAHVILTDSGGVQEEVSSLGKRVLVMREITERTEGIDQGVAELIGTTASNIVSRTLAMLDQPQGSVPPTNPYGDGHAGERIVRAILGQS